MDNRSSHILNANPDVGSLLSRLRLRLGRKRLCLQVATLGWGGTERYVQDLAIALVELGLDVLVIAEQEPLVRKPELERNGVEVLSLGMSKEIGRSGYENMLRAAYQSHKIGMVHYCVWTHPMWLEDVLAVAGIPSLRTDHSSADINLRRLLGLTWPRNWWCLWRRKLRSFRRSPRFISISEHSRRSLTRFYGNRLWCKQVYNGIPGSEYLASPGANGSAPVVAWAGAMVRRKDPLLMLRSLKGVLSQFPGVRLVMAGDGPLRAKAEAYARQAMPGHVEFLGFTDKVAQMLGRSQVFVCTSRAEGTPYVILEAMAAGVPVITTDCGAICEQVVDGSTGLVVATGDMEGLIASLARLAADPALRTELGSRGYERWKTCFTRQIMAANTLEAYVELLEMASGR